MTDADGACRPGTSGRDVARRDARRARSARSRSAVSASRSTSFLPGRLRRRSWPARRLARSLESVLGATLETAGVVNNDVLNFINTAVAAYVAIKLWRGFL